MKLNGKYLYQKAKFKNCSFLIEHERIHNLEVDLIPLDFSFKEPKNNSEFKLGEFQSERPLTPEGYDYFIEYFDENNTTHKISISLNFIQLFKIKWQLRQYLIQDKSLKLGFLKCAIISIIGYSGFWFGRLYENFNIPNPIPVYVPSNLIQKSSVNRILSKDLKKDSIIEK
jgi:hypothetical protein